MLQAFPLFLRETHSPGAPAGETAATMLRAPTQRQLLLAAAAAAAAASAAASNICGANATLGAAVLSVLNLTYPGLEAVAAAAAAGDLDTACTALADYYSAAHTASWLRRPAPPPSTARVGGAVDAVVYNDTYNEGALGSGRVPRGADGGLDWWCRGPRDDPEYQNVLNRHATFLGALDAWSATGNPDYAAWLDRTIIDWATHNPCPPGGGPAAAARPAKCFPVGDGGAPACAWGPADAPGTQACATSYTESPWRLLEQGARFAPSAAGGVGAPWPDSFFGLQAAANFSTSARALAVLVAGEHLASLVAAGAGGVSNWAILQNTGLVELALVFPELAGAPAALAGGLAALTSLLTSGVYADGVETEMAAGYDMGTAREFYGVLQLLATAGVAQPPAEFAAAVERMWAYGAYAADPSGCMPRTGDTDVCEPGYDAAVTAFFGRADWEFLHSNGVNGTVPPGNATGGPSTVFPWAGQLILRSGYGARATWVFFDAGPYGSSIHGHRDKLTVNVHARGAMLLVDSGRFAYSGDDLPAQLHVAYARNASAHSTLTVDGCDQLPQPAVAAAPLDGRSYALAPGADEAFGDMDRWDAGCLAGAATHRRAVRFVRGAGAGGGDPDDGDFLVVVDVLDSDGAPRSVQARWHAHPNASAVELNATTGVARVGGAHWAGEPRPAQACVIPATPAGGGGANATSGGWAAVSVVRGATAPFQGWYSASYDDALPASTLVYAAATPAGGAAAGVWAWLIVPSGSPRDCAGDAAAIAAVNATHVTVTVALAGRPAARLDVRYRLGG